MVSKDNADICWICHRCAIGINADIPEGRLATWHEDTCDVCGKTEMVTEPRDYYKYCPCCKHDVSLSHWTFTKAKKICREMCRDCIWRRQYGEKQTIRRST